MTITEKAFNKLSEKTQKRVCLLKEWFREAKDTKEEAEFKSKCSYYAWGLYDGGLIDSDERKALVIFMTSDFSMI